MNTYRYDNTEAGRLPFNRKWEIDYTDVAGASTSLAGTITLMGVNAGDEIANLRAHLITEFDGGATSALDAKVGYNGATADDDDAFITSAQTEWHADATATPYVLGAGASNAGGYKFIEDSDVELVVTATGANVNAITSGKVIITGNYYPKEIFEQV